MYSVVLMMAVAGSADVPAGLFGHGGGHGCCGGYTSCHGCYGGCCGGGYYSSCTGSCTGWSYSCNGCCGGGCYGSCHGGGHFMGGHKSHGCCGGGGFFGGHGHKSHGCCGGYTSCHGCTGGWGYSCTGGCYGSCTGGWGYSCTGGCVGAGCVGGAVVPGAPVMGAPVAPAPVPMPAPAPAPSGEKIEKKPKETKDGALAPAPATIIVSLPEAAKLTIDDAATTSLSARRVFVSPALPAGKEFHYTLKAEFARDGKPVTVNKSVTVRAGEETSVDLTADLAGVASR
jgi:uncharacterized protein (TIGR03000 family)